MSVFEKGPSVEKVISGGSLTFILAMLGGVFAWIFGVIFTRADIGLGKEAYGIYITGISIITVISCVTWGINQSIQKYVAEYLIIDKTKAELYARNGTIAILLIGSVICGICITLGIIYFPYDSILGLLLILIGISVIFISIKDGIIGNIAALQRFDYIAVINACLSLGTFIIGIPIILFIVKPLGYPAFLQLVPLTILGTSLGYIIQIILALYYGHKCLPYSLVHLYRGPKNKHIMGTVIKYGLYCTIPTIILSGTILWIPALLISGILGPTAPGLYGLILGYATVMLTISFMGWPMISAVSEAHALKDQKLIDDYFRNNFKSSFNLIALFLVIYIGLSKFILTIFHGSEYVYGQVPFIILAVGVSILALEFISCTIVIGVGEGRKASFVFISITLIEIVLTILFLFIFPIGSVSFAAPSAVLISSLVIFPFIPKLLKPYTTVPIPWDNLVKGIISIIISIGIVYLIDTFIFSFMSISGIIIGILILAGVYIFSMLLLAGFSDEDLEMIYSSLETFKIGFLKPLVQVGEKIIHKSPFYKKEPIRDSENGEKI